MGCGMFGGRRKSINCGEKERKKWWDEEVGGGLEKWMRRRNGGRKEKTLDWRDKGNLVCR